MIRMIIDSTCEAPDRLMSHPAVTVVPLSVIFGREALRDGVDISREQFWERLARSASLPTTSQPAPRDFLELFQRFTDAGDEVVTLTISNKLSGTYESALQAQRSLPDRPIDVIDSYSVSIGSGMMLQEALAMQAAGATRPQIVERLKAMRPNIHIHFAVDTLEYLQRGGRIGKAQAMVGTLLKFKPILAVMEGEVQAVGRVRTRRKALESLVEQLAHAVDARGPQVSIGITHGMAADDAAQVAREMANQFATERVFVVPLGPVVGVHVGPGVVGVGVYPGA